MVCCPSVRPSICIGPFSLNPGTFLQLQVLVKRLKPNDRRGAVGDGQLTGGRKVEAKSTVVINVPLWTEGRQLNGSFLSCREAFAVLLQQ